LTRSSGGPAFGECPQLIFWDRKLSNAAMQADQQLWKDPNDGFIKTIQSRKVNRNLATELLLVL